MKVLGLDNKYHVLDTRTCLYGQRNREACKSDLQYLCGLLVKERYPYDVILEECPLPGTKPCLYMDFLVPARKLAIEIHGRQHDDFVAFFHGNKKGFEKAKTNDVSKQRWCYLNDIDLHCVRSEQELRTLLGLNNV